MKIILLLTFISAVHPQYTNYEGYKVYEVSVQDVELRNKLHDYYQKNQIDYWTNDLTKDGTIKLMASSETQEKLDTFLKGQGISYGITIDNLNSVLEKERIHQQSISNVTEGEISFQKYLKFEEIEAYLKNMSKIHEHIRLLTIGSTGEGRQIWMVKIGESPPGKPIILIEAGIHAREWISPPVALYVIEQLLNNPDYRHLYEYVEWHIIPVANPDGYEYSHTTDRMWRKNRRVGSGNCDGVDVNRNFDFFWEDGVGDECSGTYHGPAPFSEPEAYALSRHVLTTNKIMLYLSFHSSGQLILHPFGHTAVPPHNVQEHVALGEKMAEAIRSQSGTTYKVGSSFDLLYPVYGGAKDWATSKGGVPLTYTVELPAGGEAGYDLPPERIFDVVRETFRGVVAAHDHIRENYRLEN